MSGLSEYGGDFEPFCDARKEDVLVEKFGGATVVVIGFPFLEIVGEESVKWRWFCGLLRVAATVSFEVGSELEPQWGWKGSVNIDD